MGRKYSVLMDAATISAADDLVRISAPADAILVIHEVIVTQDASETSEQLPLQLQRASTDGTGSSYTAKLLEGSDAAFGGTAVHTLTVDTTPGDILWRKSENVLNGWHYLPTPETRIVIPPSGRFVVRLDGAPSAALTMTATVIFEEIG
jgi:hypothetical protein